MRAIAWLRKYSVEAAWVLFAAANVAAMVALPSWETIPFHFVWISLTIVYGFRVWGPKVTSLILGAVVVPPARRSSSTHSTGSSSGASSSRCR